MAEHVVKHVRFLQIIQLVRLADEIARRKAPVGKMIEKHRIGHQARHRHHLPAGQRHQFIVQPGKIRHAGPRQVEPLQSIEKLRRHPTGQQPGLPIEQMIPHTVINGGEMFPILRNGPVRGRRNVVHPAIVAGASPLCDQGPRLYQ